jgi:DNA ligase-1
MHGHKWHGKQPLDNWLLSEKYNGWRAPWDGMQLWTRNGNILDAPHWFVRDLPSTPLDTELWAGEGTTANDVASAVRSGRWEGLCLAAFDTPSPAPFKARAQRLERLTRGCRHCGPVPYFVAEDNACTVSLLREMTAAGSEGMVARDPTAPYTPGRHASILKLKTHYL